LKKTSLISCVIYFYLGGLSSEIWVPCDSVAPQLGVWRAADAALVPDTEGIQNKVL